MNRWVRVWLACWASLGLSACSGPEAPTPPPGGEAQLQLQAVTPAIGTALPRGSSVQLSLALVSKIASPGQVSLSIHDESRAPLLRSEPSVDIAARGAALFQAEFVVPASASSIQVQLAFRPAGSSMATVVLSAAYVVQ